MHYAVIDQLNRGIHIADFELYTHAVTPGRFREENDLDLYVRNGTSEAHMLFAKVFRGRKPWYKPWFELFGIDATVALNSTAVPYFDSLLEQSLLTVFASALDPGENIFVDYHNDTETKNQLTAGFPAVLTRLGSKLYERGFTWFKDWYFPEGYMEGEQKLQAEKPLNGDSRNRHLRRIRSAVESFLDSAPDGTRRELYYERALKRAEVLINNNERAG